MDWGYRKEEYEYIYFENFIQRFLCLLKNENDNTYRNKQTKSFDPVILLLEIWLEKVIQKVGDKSYMDEDVHNYSWL